MILCIAAIQSMNYAIKAQKVLSARNIGVEIVKLDPTLTERGCAWGIQFDCRLVDEVKRTLDSKNIPYGEIIGSRR